MSTMIRCRHNLDALFIFLVWLAARTVDADALETKGESTPGGRQNRENYPVQSDPHYDPHSAFPWGADSVSDDDPPFGIIRRRGGKGSDSSWQLTAGRGRQVTSRVQESESNQLGVGVSGVAMRTLRGMSEMLHRMAVGLRALFDDGWVRWWCEKDRCRHRSEEALRPAPGDPPLSVRRAKLVEEGARGEGEKKRYTEERWTGDVEIFLADRKMGRVDELGSQLPLRVTTLEKEIRREFLTVVDLTDLACPNHECPRFASCPQNFSSEFRACTNTRLSILTSDPSRDPLNCPDNRANKTNRENVVPDPSCTHKADAISHSPYLARISVLKDVYVSWGGHTFDEQNLYNQEGCSKLNYFNYSGGTPVSVFKEVVNIAHGHGYAFYHGVIEVFPLFLLIADLMPHVKGIPIAQRIRQEILYDPVGQLLVGLSKEEYNGYGVLSNELFFGHRVYVPEKQKCGRPSKALWHVLRKNHFIPPDGVPMLNPDWTIRTPKHVAREKNGYPEDWVVILGKRYGERALEQSDAVEAALKRLFTPERVQIFDGDVGILEDLTLFSMVIANAEWHMSRINIESSIAVLFGTHVGAAKAMFNRARLFVTPHGALCVNMVFMPFGGHLFEMRPREYPNPCFHHLAEVCELQFYLVMGNGTKHTNIGVEMPEVVRTLEMIKGRMVKEEKEMVENDA